MSRSHLLKALYAFAIAVAVLTLAFRALDWTARRGGPLPAVPEPNAYNELLSIAGKIKPPPGDLVELSSDLVKESARENRPALARIHEVLKAPGGVPLKVERGWSTNHEAEVKQLKRLAVALGLESRAGLAEGRTNDAIRAHLDMLLLGQAMARGGLVFDGISGMTVETLGYGCLRGDLALMDAAACRSAAKELEQAEARREPPERILATEKSWALASFGLVGRVARWLHRDAVAKGRSEFISRSHQTMRRTRHLMLALAARASELETGKRPAQVSELVPAFLAAVPLDPATGAALTEIPSAGSHEAP